MTTHDNAVGQGFPPGWPLGTSTSDADLAVIYGGTEVEVEVIPPVPEPEVRARLATAAEIPGGARIVASAAIKAGFTTRTTYARGPRLDSHERVIEITDSILLRAGHADGRRALACWITKTATKGAKAGQSAWSFEFAYTTTPYLTRVDSTALRAYLQVSTQ